MGVTNLKLWVPFGAVNLSHDRTYREGWVRHHLLPLQSLRDRALQPFLSSLSDDGFHMDDFRTNGILLPALQSIGKFAGLPVHFGGHPNYNGEPSMNCRRFAEFANRFAPDRGGVKSR
jgi:A nuclease family of the HNH/ENDO VII superfamily with conserved AHH